MFRALCVFRDRGQAMGAFDFAMYIVEIFLVHLLQYHLPWFLLKHLVRLLFPLQLPLLLLHYFLLLLCKMNQRHSRSTTELATIFVHPSVRMFFKRR